MKKTPSRKRNVTFKRRNDGANLLMDAAGASILESMGHDDDLRAARTLSMLSDGIMNSRRYSPNTHSMGRILSMPSVYVPPPSHTMSDIVGTPHSIGNILDDVNYPVVQSRGIPPFNPYDPPASLSRDINPGVVPRGPRAMGPSAMRPSAMRAEGGGMGRKGSTTTTTKPLNVHLGPPRLSSRKNSGVVVKPVGKKNSGGLSRITSGVEKPPPRRVQQLRESTLKKASSAGKCGGGRGTRRSGARRTRRARR